MVHTRHSFKESYTSNKSEGQRGRQTRRSGESADRGPLVNGGGTSPHGPGRPRKRRKLDDGMSYLFDSRDYESHHDHFTRHSTRTSTRASASFSEQQSVAVMKREKKKRPEMSDQALAQSFSEPRRSSRQRREVYGTLNETLLVRNRVSRDAEDQQGGRNGTGNEEDNEGEEDEEAEEEDSEDDEEGEGSEDEEEDQGSQGRPYSFREKRTTTRRYCAPPIAGKSRRREAFYDAVPHSPMHKRRHHRMPQHGGAHKRKHYGSSTSSSGDSDNEHRFERRKAKSMAKARARCLPMNFQSGDILGVLKDRERARDRQGTGSSLADVDPMNIDKGVTFESVGGLDQHLSSLKEMIVFPLLYPEVFEKFKIAPPRGVLFYGPPGTGKTLVARALANECSSEGHKVAFFMRKGADCLSKWVGESERQLRLLFDQAYSMRPSIIFFDEIDGLAPVRSTRQDQIHSSIVSTLLALMDGLDSRGEVIVIGATNRIDSIDPALRRPGRFDREFLFTLPNRVARRTILEIHTKEWHPRLSKNFVKELADQCVGYCGADIKALCTEAALVALRRRYPQIYGTNKKLVLDTDDIKITAKDFQYALRKVVPASQRSVVSPGRALNDNIKPLLESTLELVLEKIRGFFPPAKTVKDVSSATGNSSSKNNSVPADLQFDSSDDDDDENQRSIYEPLSYGRSTRTTQRTTSPLPEYANFLQMHTSQMRPLAHRARYLMTGQEGMGQSTHLAPAILYSMEHLKVYVLDLPSLFGVSARVPEEACSQIFTEARRTPPCIIYVPHIDIWWSSISETCRATFLTLLDDLPPSLSVMLISTSNCVLEELPERVKDLFSPMYDEVFEVTEPTEEQRRVFFHGLLLKNALEPPPKQKPKKVHQPLEILAVAAPPPKRQLSDEELKNLRQLEENILRELRLFLRQVVWKLMADRKFKEFMKPVDLEEVPDYYGVIKDPMDLSTLMTKINSHKYTTCAQLLKDVDKITNNCLEYNPDRDTYDRLLRNRACELRDTAHAMIYADLDPEFEKMCEEIDESRCKRNETDDIFAPSYIRVLQKNQHPIRPTSTATTSSAPQPAQTDTAQSTPVPEPKPLTSSMKHRHIDTPYSLKSTRQSRRLRGEESVDIPSFSTPLESIIRSPDGRRGRGRPKKSESNKGNTATKIEEKNENDVTEIKRSEDTEENEVEMDGVQKIEETTETEEYSVLDDSALDESQGENSIIDEEKPPKEKSFVVMDKTERDITASNEGADDEKDDEIYIKVTSNEVICDEKQSKTESHQKIEDIKRLSPLVAIKPCILTLESYKAPISPCQASTQEREETDDAELMGGHDYVCKMEKEETLLKEVTELKTIDKDEPKSVDSCKELEAPCVDNDHDVCQIMETCNFDTDETSQREAFEDLLSRLVTATESCSVISLEKTYFTVNNMIYKNRKNLDKAILIKELDCFIKKLADERR